MNYYSKLDKLLLIMVLQGVIGYSLFIRLMYFNHRSFLQYHHVFIDFDTNISDISAQIEKII